MASAQGGDESAVVDAFRAGGADALTAVYARWSPLVYTLALRCLDDVGRAEEVTRQVFTQAWAVRETFDPTGTRLSDWLVDLACRSIARSRTATGRPDLPSAQANLEESDERESKTRVLAEQCAVADSMSHLDTSSRRVLQMALAHSLTLGEIAERTGLRVEEVRSQVASSLRELRQKREAQADAH